MRFKLPRVQPAPNRENCRASTLPRHWPAAGARLSGTGGVFRATENGARFNVIGVTDTLLRGQAFAAVIRVQAWPSSDSTRVRLSVMWTCGETPYARAMPGLGSGRFRFS